MNMDYGNFFYYNKAGKFYLTLKFVCYKNLRLFFNSKNLKICQIT